MIVKERESDLLYEAELFDDFVLVRPASPDFDTLLERVSFLEFEQRFDEFWGSPESFGIPLTTA